MSRFTFERQNAILSSDVKDDTLSIAATLESAAVTLEDDENAIRSMLAHLVNLQTGNWYDAISTPGTFEGGTQRGINTLNQDLHDLERKRVLAKAAANALTDVAVPASQNWVILGTGELPPNTTAALGAVTTRGTVVAAHGGTFGTHSLAEVAGGNAVAPKNFVEVVDGATRDPILSSGREVYGLLHAESGLSDGGTITDTTTTRVQVSFVRLNATGDDLEACPVADIESHSVGLVFTERKALEDLNEQDFLGGAVVDVPSGSTVTRQVAYDNQGTTPVDLTTNATLDLEGAGLVWAIRDDLEAILFRIVEGSAGGTSAVNVAGDVDTFDVDAVVNDFANGASFDTAGTPVDVGVNPGVVERAADLTLRATAAGEVLFDDGNRGASTYSTAIKLADTSTEWDDFETEFGEVSLLNAIVQASNKSPHIKKTTAVITATTSPDTDVGGVSGGTNLDAQIHDLSGGVFITDHDVYLNGRILRGGADASANFDYYPGTSLANGQLKFEFEVVASPGNPDVLTVISRA